MRALAHADEQSPATVALLRRWVEQDSYTGAAGDVNAMGALLQEAFALPELSVVVRPGQSWAIACAFGPAPRTTSPIVASCWWGHHDTVFPPGHSGAGTSRGTKCAARVCWT